LFDSVASSVNYPELEMRIIEFWKEQDIFAKSVAKDAPLGRYVFFEGPPTANGLPGVHHVISRAYKDLFPRFKTMQGHRVLRKGGWDTHGLPVEIAIEQRLGFTSKAQIEEYGIARFNELCRQYVFENIADWNRMTERIGFWLNLEDAYVTYHKSYIESCWWIMKQLWDRGLLTEDYRTTWHSPSSNTTLASHEVALDYRDNVPDPSIFPKFSASAGALRAAGVLPDGEERPVYYLAWTTTPWTLPANSGLAVNPHADYALVAAGREYGAQELTDLYIVAASLVGQVFADTPHEVLRTFPASALQGQKYTPLLQGRPGEGQDTTAAWRVILDDFVTLDDGTGLVHIAPGYGDLEQGRAHNLPAIFSVGLDGLVLPEVKEPGTDAGAGPWTGVWFKDADSLITASLQARGLMFRSGTILHSYPFNWRDGTPLMNVAKKSWYIRTTDVREKLLENNAKINWHPENIGTGRFGRWLENNVDWALSRERFWGATMPIWESESGQRICVGSVAELEQLTGRDHSELDLHRPYIDEITFEHNGELFTRVPYTIDVWFESGAMPYAQWNYQGDSSPDGVKRELAANFPADYICEAVDQTRGWFYSLHALATLLTDTGDEGRAPGPLAELAPDSPAFKNVIVLGHIVDDNGEKMSKSKGNVIDPWEVLDVQGADVLRWYLYSSSPPGATKRFSVALVDETMRDFFNTLWNTYYFFVLYANLDRPALAVAPAPAERPLTDRWLLARLHALIIQVTEQLENYDSTGASRAIRDFVVDDLSNWYVRRNRRRFWKGGQGADKLAAYASLYEALVTVAQLIAPLAPFISEELYRNLVARNDVDAPESVHLSSWPVADAALLDHELLHDMSVLQRIVELGRSARAESGVKTRQPLPELLVRVRNDAEQAGLRQLEADLLDELNVKKISYLDVAADFIDYSVRPNLPLVGKRVGKLIPELRRVLDEIDGRELARAIREGRDTTLLLNGESFTFEPEAFLLDARSPEGYAAAEDRGYLAALDTQLTPELIREGYARDLIRVIQNARRNAGLEVSDKIDLVLEAGAELTEVMEEFGSVIAGEVLALTFTPSATASGPGWHTETVELDGLPVTFSLIKV
jgi:isoleucyl-tRNA synthetase